MFYGERKVSSEYGVAIYSSKTIRDKIGTHNKCKKSGPKGKPIRSKGNEVMCRYEESWTGRWEQSH